MRMRHGRPSPRIRAAFAALVLSARAAGAQHEGHDGPVRDSVRGIRLMAQAIPVVTRAVHTAGAATLTEGYVSQAMLMGQGSWRDGALRLDAALNGEGITMRRGELSTGGFGEGYVDRRHPHTYVHELMLSGIGSARGASWSVSAGRGFAPFGTDDPMMRPMEKFPINHHLAQILERGLLAAAVRVGPVIAEGATFTGEEPTSPSSLPRPGRFGDSWSLRATVLPWSWSEIQASYARVASPEDVQGFGLDQRKQSISARLIDAAGRRYLLAEWARTVDHDHNLEVDVFAYESALVEAAFTVGRAGVAVRLEQTERPEEERRENPFRSARPAADFGISGATRWRAATLAFTLPPVTRGAFGGFPFLEVEWLRVSSRDSRSIFVPERFYGSASPWMVSAGVRLRAGPMHARMGRYGVARTAGPAIGTLAGPGVQHQH
jgi:hypothetical protein